MGKDNQEDQQRVLRKRREISVSLLYYFGIILNHKKFIMKQLTLSFREFYNFKTIAKFIYEFTISKNAVIIKADSKMLEELGY